jgi:hypothetical protein
MFLSGLGNVRSRALPLDWCYESRGLRLSTSTSDEVSRLPPPLAQPSQLRTIFGVFAISFAVKWRVSIAKL